MSDISVPLYTDPATPPPRMTAADIAKIVASRNNVFGEADTRIVEDRLAMLQSMAQAGVAGRAAYDQARLANRQASANGLQQVLSESGSAPQGLLDNLVARLAERQSTQEGFINSADANWQNSFAANSNSAGSFLDRMRAILPLSKQQSDQELTIGMTGQLTSAQAEEARARQDMVMQIANLQYNDYLRKQAEAREDEIRNLTWAREDALMTRSGYGGGGGGGYGGGGGGGDAARKVPNYQFGSLPDHPTNGASPEAWGIIADGDMAAAMNNYANYDASWINNPTIKGGSWSTMSADDVNNENIYGWTQMPFYNDFYRDVDEGQTLGGMTDYIRDQYNAALSQNPDEGGLFVPGGAYHVTGQRSSSGLNDYFVGQGYNSSFMPINRKPASTYRPPAAVNTSGRNSAAASRANPVRDAIRRTATPAPKYKPPTPVNTSGRNAAAASRRPTTTAPRRSEYGDRYRFDRR